MDIGLIRMRYTPYGGAEIFVSRFVDELLQKGHMCHIFAREWDRNTGVMGKGQGANTDSRLKTYPPEADSKLIFHKVKAFGPSFLRLLSFAANSYFAIRKANLDIVISFDRTLYQDIYRAGDGCHREWLFQRQKVWSMEHRAWGRNTIKKLTTCLNPLHLTILYLEKKLFQSKRLKFVVANSKRGRDEIIRHYSLPEGKFCVIYNGIDIKAFNLNDREKIRVIYRERLNIKNETLLLFVGSGFERKGLRFLIEALGILKRKGYERLKLVVVGKGEMRKYQALAELCGAGEDVKFIGPASDVKGYYCAADIFVLPSIYEPFSNACLEAMASQLPVVTSRINGVSEILTSGKDGMIVDDPSNPEEIAEKIKPLLHEETRLTVGKAARKTVENYTIENNVESFLRVIEEVKKIDSRPKTRD